eukprot:TRINITY_DN3769_c0_g1_i1.p1 TRINITY_DN3769_c0_g1~~TRINITY_DN3769_c0_g1_i1.p1  ORF type:complete len:413 (+),score=96.84 TRINITY_DN3769_c0_g1_i1:22-1239(+)
MAQPNEGDGPSYVLFGMDAEHEKRMTMKHDPQYERQALDWVQQITGMAVPNVFPSLKSGEILCVLLNKLRPGIVPKINKNPSHVLLERENIQAYIMGCGILGVEPDEMFTISDLQDRKMLSSVVMNLYALGRCAQTLPGWSGPRLGVKYSVTQEEKRRRKDNRESERLIANAQAQQYREERASRHALLEKQKSETAIKVEDSETERMKKRRMEKGRSQYDLKKAKRKSISPVRYGLDLEHQEKLVTKALTGDALHDEAVMDWIEFMTGQEVDGIYDSLRSGVVLCLLVNAIKPDTIPRIHMKPVPMLEMENIQAYLNACAAFGVPRSELFSTSDLYEHKSIPAVVSNLYALARAAQKLPSYTKGKGKGAKFNGSHAKKRARGDVDLEAGVVKEARYRCCSSCTIL